MIVEKIEGRKVCSPALDLAPILDPPLIVTAIQTSDGMTLCPTIGAVAARHLSPLLLASLHACLQTVEILTGHLTEVKVEDGFGHLASDRGGDEPSMKSITAESVRPSWGVPFE